MSWLVSQLDTSVMRSPDGQWSLVGVLIVGFAGTLTALVWIFRRMDADRTQEIKDLKQKIDELEERNRLCYEDRLKIHAELVALRREVELLKLRG
jgi:hypothetical protein